MWYYYKACVVLRKWVRIALWWGTVGQRECAVMWATQPNCPHLRHTLARLSPCYIKCAAPTFPTPGYERERMREKCSAQLLACNYAPQRTHAMLTQIWAGRTYRKTLLKCVRLPCHYESVYVCVTLKPDLNSSFDMRLAVCNPLVCNHKGMAVISAVPWW